MADICKTGCWIDKASGAVVDEQPVEGRLLVAPGGALTPDINAAIERARKATPVEVAVVEPAGETEQVDEAKEDTAAPAAKETATTPTAKRGR